MQSKLKEMSINRLFQRYRIRQLLLFFPFLLVLLVGFFNTIATVNGAENKSTGPLKVGFVYCQKNEPPFVENRLCGID
jgi:hypothetical protein